MTLKNIAYPDFPRGEGETYEEYSARLNAVLDDALAKLDECIEELKYSKEKLVSVQSETKTYGDEKYLAAAEAAWTASVEAYQASVEAYKYDCDSYHSIIDSFPEAMTESKIISFPEPSFESKYCIYPRMGADGKTYFTDVASYSWDQSDLLHEVTRPFNFGWVETQAACLQRRTKEEFIKMFQINNNDVCVGLMGFRDVEEAMVCETAALEVGSPWRFIDYYRQHKLWGGDGLGCLNTALAEYASGYIPNLLTERFPAPPSQTK